jgi:hypothetical protein
LRSAVCWISARIAGFAVGDERKHHQFQGRRHQWQGAWGPCHGVHEDDAGDDAGDGDYILFQLFISIHSISDLCTAIQQALRCPLQFPKNGRRKQQQDDEVKVLGNLVSLFQFNDTYI